MVFIRVIHVARLRGGSTVHVKTNPTSAGIFTVFTAVLHPVTPYMPPQIRPKLRELAFSSRRYRIGIIRW